MGQISNQRTPSITFFRHCSCSFDVQFPSLHVTSCGSLGDQPLEAPRGECLHIGGWALCTCAISLGAWLVRGECRCGTSARQIAVYAIERDGNNIKVRIENISKTLPLANTMFLFRCSDPSNYCFDEATEVGVNAIPPAYPGPITSEISPISIRVTTTLVASSVIEIVLGPATRQRCGVLLRAARDWRSSEHRFFRARLLRSPALAQLLYYTVVWRLFSCRSIGWHSGRKWFVQYIRLHGKPPGLSR